MATILKNIALSDSLTRIALIRTNFYQALFIKSLGRLEFVISVTYMHNYEGLKVNSPVATENSLHTRNIYFDPSSCSCVELSIMIIALF